MDSNRFDQFTRLVASGGSRRDLFRLLAGGVAAGVGISSRPSATGAQPCVANGLPCELDTDCCEGFCSDQDQVCFIPCNDFGESCPNGDECCLPLICTNGACGLPCAPLGDSCADLPCCNGTCNASDICEDSVTCLEEHVPCSATSIPCCVGFTCTGGCCGGCVFSCVPQGNPCQEGIPCCGDHSCIEGCCGCPTGACIPPQQPCDDVLPCCEDLVCIDDCCGGCAECIPEGEPCETTGCCPGLVCNEFMTACVPDCGLPNQPCQSDDDCCEGGGGVALECRGGACHRCAVTGFNKCSEQVPCCEPGTVCNEATGACGFPTCVPKWGPCQHDHECCKGLFCDAKKQVCKGDDRCGGLGDHCEVQRDCCQGLTCFEGLCDIPRGCVDKGNPCHPDVLCCDTLVCDGTHCAKPSFQPEKPSSEVSTLPSTGGAGPGSSTSWLGALAAGSVVAAAASLLRRNREHSG